MQQAKCKVSTTATEPGDTHWEVYNKEEESSKDIIMSMRVTKNLTP